MCTDHDKPIPAVVGPQHGVVDAARNSVSNAQRSMSFKSAESLPDDIESHEMTYSGSRAGEIDLNYYHLVDEVWHFCSVDWGSRCKMPPFFHRTKFPLTYLRSLHWI